MEKPKAPNAKNQSAPSAPPSNPPPSAPATLTRPPSLFRKIDWLTFGITTLIVFIGYFLTLAPELTLEDSGELATASFYAGIPHPPGYPVWTLYTWFFAKFLPFSNVAWRVAFGEALAGAAACGLLALMVSRGGSMMLEGIAAMKPLERRWENAICVVSGFIAGTLMGFNGFMWSQSVIVEVYSFGVLSLMGTLCFLLRWVYAPQQRRYLYLAFFAFGICFTNHQTLILAAMGLEVAILVVDLRIGRDLMLGNSIIYLVGLTFKHLHILTSFDSNQSLFLIYNIVGVLSLAAFITLMALTMKTAKDWIVLARDFLLVVFIGYVVAMMVFASGYVTLQDVHLETRSPWFLLIHLFGIGSLALLAWLVEISPKRDKLRSAGAAYWPVLGLAFLFVLSLTYVSAANKGLAIFWLKASLSRFWIYLGLGLAMLIASLWLTSRRREVGSEVKVVVMLGLMWVLGAGFYFYMPIAGMSCPPLQWGYPRTVEGFFHALSRGQYESTHPVDIFKHWAQFIGQLGIMREGVGAEFNWVYTLLALVPFLFFFRLQKRERSWLIGLTAIYLFMGVLLVILLNPARDRQSLELNRVFFTATHAIVAMGIGYGLTLLLGSLAATPEALRRWLPLATLFLGVTALHTPVSVIFDTYGRGVSADGISSLVYCWVWFAAALMLWMKSSGTRVGLLVASGITAAIGLFELVTGVVELFDLHLFFREPRGAKIDIAQCFNLVLHGFREKLLHGDPFLRFYGALLVVLIVALALALLWAGRQKLRLSLLLGVVSLMPLYSVFSNWADNEQRHHYFGYWFGHDMFTPPFVSEGTGRFSYDPELRMQAMKGANARQVYPEMTRDAILFGGTDPGRFCPTYMIFCESFIPPACKPLDPKFDRRDVYIITQNALADPTYLSYIRSQFFRSAQKDPPFFKELLRTPRERDLNYSTNLIAALAYRLLDVPLTELGAKIEAERRRAGVYPPNEIYTPSQEDSSKCFADYMADAQNRILHDRQLPNEPKQVRAGEDVNIVNDRIQVSGQVAVMAINGLLTKVIFDRNPTNEFYVEESFPLEWMYPHITPFGIIMKINREPLPELTDEILKRDHEFWSKYSERLIGNWITYDTSVRQICDFIEKIHVQKDLGGFTGDRAFIRDDQGQKAFSKLRSSIAGVYSWRLGIPGGGAPTPTQYTPKTDAERQRMVREADFAYRQAFAFCPYSPEALFRYVNLLLYTGRMDDAMLLAQTSLKLDPDNGQILNLINTLNDIKRQAGNSAQQQKDLAQLEAEVRANPTNFPKAFELAGHYVQLQQSDRAMQLLDRILGNPAVDVNSVLTIADAYARMNNYAKLETVLIRLTQITPNEPEAWYDLASCRASLGKADESKQALRRALELSAGRLGKSPGARDLRAEAEKDGRFTQFRASPELKEFFTNH